MNPPTPDQPLRLTVDGVEMEIDRCPADAVGDAFEVLRLADLAQRGKWPVGGGWLDETAWFVSAVESVARAQAWAESLPEIE